MSIKRVTSQDVANYAGVSRTTVSLVLNNVKDAHIREETRQRVLQAARELDYHPHAGARRLVLGRSQVIGFVERHSPYQDFADAFMAEVLRGLHEAARHRQYHVLYDPLASREEDGNDFMQLIRERHADGIVLSGPRYDDRQLYELERGQFPVVLQGRLPGSQLPWVDVDNAGGARLATEHLLALGHRRIGLITNGPLLYTAAAERRSGFLMALQESGLDADPDLIQVGEFSSKSGYQAMQRILRVDPRPSAVFVASDTVAIGAIEAARQQQLNLPADLAIVGFDDIPWSAYLNPPLTTVHLPAHRLGWNAGQLLIRMLNQEPIDDASLLLETRLIVRSSCGSEAGGSEAGGSEAGGSEAGGADLNGGGTTNPERRPY